jgi:DNA-binding response OmpR family regulator
MKILIVEDDPAIASLLERALAEEGWRTRAVADGEEGLYLAEVEPFDLMILDWMLPGLEGTEILYRLRRKGIGIPVLMLTARGKVRERIEGLRKGADDYLVKPFSLEELIERIRALYRRSVGSGHNRLEAGPLSVDLAERTVMLEGKPLALKHKEYELLLFLMKHRGAPVSISMIEEQLWGDEEFLQSNVIQVTIYKLRKKIGKERIRTSRGMGYILDV